MSSSADDEEATLLLDRLVHSPSEENLEALIAMDPSTVWDAVDTVQIFLDCFRNTDTASLMGRLYLQLLPKGSKRLLSEPSPGVWIEAVMEIASDVNQNAYTRVLALQILSKCAKIAPQLTQTQLLSSVTLPLLVQILKEEDVSVSSVLVTETAPLLFQWPGVAQICMFADVCDVLVQMALQQGGLTKGNALVLDCLRCLPILLRHNASWADLVLDSNHVVPGLLPLLDLTRASLFVEPPTVVEDDLDDLLSSASSSKKKQQIPKLLVGEEDIIMAVLDTLETLMPTDEMRQKFWQRHVPVLDLVWELALLVPPLEDFSCGVPSVDLQCRALDVVANYLADEAAMERHNGLDRLLFIMCTGGALPTASRADKRKCAYACREVLMATLSNQEAILMHTLAPPPDESEHQESVVAKLWTTVRENLQLEDSSTRTQFLVGALAGLEVFGQTPAQRSLLWKIGEGELVVQQLSREPDELVRYALWRFLAQVVVETDTVAHAILQAQPPLHEQDHALALLVAGLCLDGLGNEDECGGWTRQALVQVISKQRNWTQRLESLSQSKSLPWPTSGSWWKWYQARVLQVKRAVVSQFASNGGTDSSNDETVPMSQYQQLQALVEQQGNELSNVRQDWQEAQAKLTKQAHELEAWERRVAANPTQLDDMLSEFTKQNSQLEQKVSSLEQDLAEQREGRQKADQANAETISKIQSQVSEGKQQQQAITDERDRLESELASLSQTYTNLEVEYRRYQEEAVTKDVASADSSQVATTLRAENERLHQEAKAADEWMAMAVDRMNSMEAQISELQADASANMGEIQERLVAAQAQLQTSVGERDEAVAQSNAATMEIANLHKQLAAARTELHQAQGLQSQAAEKLCQLEEQARGQESTIHSLQSQLNEANATIDTELSGKREEVTTLRSALEEARGEIRQLSEQPRRDSGASDSEQIEQLNKEIEDLKKQEQEAIFSRESRIRELEGRLDGGLDGFSVQDIRARDEEIAQLQAANDEAQAWMSRAVEHDRVLNEQVATLTQETTSLRAQLATSAASALNSVTSEADQVLDAPEEISNRDTIIISLEKKIGELSSQLEVASSLQGSLDTEKSQQEKALTQLEGQASETDELRDECAKANSALDELQRTLLTKEEEIQEQKTRIHQLEASSSNSYKALGESTEDDQSSPLEERASYLEQQLADQSEQARTVIDQWQQSYATLEAENDRLRNSLVDLSHQDVDNYNEAGEKVKDLEKRLADQEAEARSVIAQWEESYSALQTEYESIKSQEMSNETESLRAHLSELEESSQDKIQGLEAEVAQHKTELQAVEAESNRVLTQWQDRYAELEARVNVESKELEELESLRARLAQIEQPGVRSDELEYTVKNLEKRLADQEAEARSVIAQWEESYSALQTEYESIKSQEMSNETESLRAHLSELEESSQDKIQGLEAEVAQHKTELQAVEAESNRVLTQWQDRYAELEARVNAESKELEELESLRTRVVELESSERSDRIMQLESKAKDLTLQMEGQRDEASVSLSKWQNRCVELEDRVKVMCATHPQELQLLKHQLEDLQNESAQSLEIWQRRSEDLEAQNNSKHDRILELEADMNRLKSQLEKQEAEAHQAIEEWRSSYGELETRIQSAGDAAHDEDLDKVSQLESAVASLEEQLAEQAREAHEVIEKWELSYEELQSRLSRFENSPSQQTNEEIHLQLEKERAEAENAISQWQERCASLEELVMGTEQEKSSEDGDQKQSRLEELEAAVDEWRTSYAELETRLEEATQTLQRQLEEQEMEAQTIIANKEEELREGTEELKLLRSKMAELEKTSESVVKGLEARIEDLSKQVETNDAAANAVAQADNEVNRLNQLLASVQQEKDEVCAAKDARVAELRRTCDNLKEEAASEKFELSRQLSDFREKEKFYLEEQDRLKALLALAEDSSRHYQELQDQIVQLEESLRTHQNMNSDLTSRYEDAVKQRDSVSNNLEKVKDELSTVRDQRESLKRNIDALVDESNRELADSGKALELAKSELAAVRETESGMREKLNAKSTEISKLSSRLELTASGDSEVFQQLKSHLADQRTKVNSLENHLHELHETLNQERSDAEAAIADWDVHCKHLETDVVDRDALIASFSAEREKTQSELEGLHSKLSNERLERQNLERELQETKRSLHSHDMAAMDDSQRRAEESADLKTQLSLQQGLLAGAQQKAAVAKQQLEILTMESEEVVGQWKDRAEELEALVSQLQTRLNDQESEAVAAIRSWEDRCTELERNVEVLDTALEASQSEGASLDNDLAEELKASQDAFSQASKRIAELERHCEDHNLDGIDRSTSESTPKDGSETKSLLDQRHQALIKEADLAKGALARSEHQYSTLKSRVAELEDELREANDALQLHITNEVTDKAAETVVSALKAEVDEIRSSMEATKMVLSEERKKRETAEVEARRLRYDLATLLGMDGTDETQTEIQRQTLEVADSLHRQECIEIADLKKALTNVLDEVDRSQQGERLALERATGLELEVATYEHELVAIKAEMKFMNESIDDVKASESARRSALESRIESMENEKSVLRRAYSAETENLQNELNQLGMERDRLFQSLKESERSREALVDMSTTNGQARCDLVVSSVETEVARLRLEKTQLLSAATDERARSETRLREVRAATAASANADLLLETDLRHAAETSLASVKSELESLRSDYQNMGSGYGSEEELNELHKKNNKLKRELESIKEENEDLRKTMEDAVLDAEVKMSKVIEECREARLRASQLEQKSHYEAQVRVEVARLQATDENIPHQPMCENPADSSDDESLEKSRESALQTAHLFDVVQQQQRAIEDERNVYFELLAEHDDLLALLAQHDLLRTVLVDALANSGGQASVEEAIASAEKQAVELYGKFMKFAE